MARDWEAVGLDWIAEPVSRVFGENNASDRRVVATAQLPVVRDLDLLAAAGVNVLAWLNAANSMRVRAQAIARDHKGDIESLREKVWNALLGVRMAGSRVVTKTVRKLSDGTTYEGDNQTEFVSLEMAALVDLGIDADTARTLAEARW